MSAPGGRRPRRALLFCPGTERKKIEKAGGAGADAVILDLEDAAALSKKKEARETVAAALGAIDFGRSERLVRINPVGTGLAFEDLIVTTAGPRPPDGYVIPKVESKEDVQTVARFLDEAEQRAAMPAGTIRLLAIIETARGVVRLAEIAAASARLEALIFGAEDLCGDLGAVRTREGREVFYAKSAVALHAAAERLQAIDTPFVDLADEAALAAETREALGMGYQGKLAIHPKQVAPITAVFTPSAAEIEAAERLLREHERHQAEGRGVFALDGRMVDMPMVRAAERVLARARAAGVGSP
jgi:citrate lyase beta subunit